MQLYANVDGQKRLPFQNGRGTCACCCGLLIAKCGQINAHHWAHESRADCDPWSEPIGPWHLWWQGLVRPEFVEVGLVRSREWFADAFLSNVREPNGSAGRRFIPELGGSDPWARKSPVWKLKHPTIWVDPGTGQTVTYSKSLWQN